MLRSYLKEEILHEIASSNQIKGSLRPKILEEFKARHQLPTDEALQAFAAQNMLTLEDIQILAERPSSIQQYIRDKFLHKAEARFLQRKDFLDQVIYSLIRVDRESLARELHLQIAEGEADFSSLAAKHSQGPEKQTRGVVGPAPLNQAHPLLTQRLRSSKPGDLLKPLQIEEWWVVVRLEQRLEASFDDVTANRMAAELFEQWMQETVELRLKQTVEHAELI